MVDLVYVFDEKSLLNNFETTLEFFSKKSLFVKEVLGYFKAIQHQKHFLFSGRSRNSIRGFQVCM